MKPLKRKAWSPRSQRSWLEHRKLESELAACKITISDSEKKIAESKKDVERLVSLEVSGGQVHPCRLTDQLAEVQERERKVTAYKLRCASLESQIKSLSHLSGSQTAARLKNQKLLASLTRARLEKVRLIDGAFERVGKLLQEWRELTAKMREAALAIEFMLSADSLSERRFDALLNSLPEALLPEAEKWTARFLGEEQTKRYIVRQQGLTLPETLANFHAYDWGDVVSLSEEQANELLSRCPSNDPPIEKIDGCDGADVKGRGKKELKIEIMRPVDYGEGKEVTHFEPGIYTLPRRVAIKLLMIRLSKITRQGTVNSPVACICQETGSRSAPVVMPPAPRAAERINRASVVTPGSIQWMQRPAASRAG